MLAPVHLVRGVDLPKNLANRSCSKQYRMCVFVKDNGEEVPGVLVRADGETLTVGQQCVRRVQLLAAVASREKAKRTRATIGFLSCSAAAS